MIKHIHDTESYKYADRVLSGNQVASRFIILASGRFMADLESGKFIYDLKEIERIRNFWGKVLYVPELKRPEPLQPPHSFWIEQLYGFKWDDTGLRRFNSVYIQMARKNLKTFCAAGITVDELILGNDDFAEIMHGANSRDQAIICTDKTGKLIKASPELRELVDKDLITLHTYKKKVNEIIYETDSRFCRVEAMPRNPGDGGNPSIGIVDEFHEARDTDLLETIESGQGQRLEPLTFVITSPGSNKAGPCYTTLRQKSKDILEGHLDDDTHLAIMFELDNEGEWDNIDMLEKSNPMMPYISTLKPYLERRIKKAKIEGGAVMANIKIKNSGIWVDAPQIWIPSEIIRKNNHGTDPNELIGRKCYAGLDLSAGKDLNAFVLLFPGEIFAVRSFFWIPEEKILNQKDDSVDYRRWADEGFVNVFDGNVVDYNVIAEMMVEELNKYDVVSMGCDPKYLYTGPVSWMSEHAPEYIKKIMPVAQGFGLTGATEMIEQWTANERMELFGNPVLSWNFSNATLHLKDMGSVQEGGISGHKYPAKGKSSNRIDGVSALVNSVHEYLRLSVEPKPSEPTIEIWN